MTQGLSGLDTGPGPLSHRLDTVELAARTSDVEQPYGELGLKSDEYARIRDILGRRPTTAELAMYSVMWSEHCSYKSSKVHLRRFGDLPRSEVLLVGIGENAGVVAASSTVSVTRRPPPSARW